MKNNLLVLAIMVSSQIMIGLQSHAEDGCKNPKSSYDKTFCTAKLFLESDNELNQVYKELKDSLKKEQKDKLTAAQRKWITFRDESCSQNGTIDVDCNFKVNKDRGEYLRDRNRECKTGHCDLEKIAVDKFAAPAS